MLIITCIIGIVCVNFVNTEKNNDSTFFQRMATLLIYQIEDSDQNFKDVIRDYEEKYTIYCLLKEEDGSILYQSSALTFPTNISTLLERFSEQLNSQETIEIGTEAVTTQGGVFEVNGTSGDHYLGLPAKISLKNGSIYYLTLIYKQQTASELLQKQLPFYLLIWMTAFLGVVIISHLLLKKTLEPTERVLKSQKEFVASASHELKTPLANILANAETIANLTVDSSLNIQTPVKIIDSECMRMSRLIRDMLLLVSSDAQTWTLNKKNVNVDTVLITLYETYEPLCKKEKLILNLNISESSYPLLYTDEERMFQIISIFMDNAIQHAKNNASIQIQTSQTNKTLTFYVIDHGRGISDEEKPFVFDRFYCADKSHGDKSHFGLGLSIAEELAKMLNATVGLQDTSGGGATFFVTFPINEMFAKHG